MELNSTPCDYSYYTCNRTAVLPVGILKIKLIVHVHVSSPVLLKSYEPLDIFFKPAKHLLQSFCGILETCTTDDKLKNDAIQKQAFQ